MFLALGLLDMLMDKCATSFHVHIGNKDFMQVLVVILNDETVQPEVFLVCDHNIVSLQILKKIVYLIQKWGIRYEKEQTDKLLFFDVYTALQKNGVYFPPVF